MHEKSAAMRSRCAAASATSRNLLPRGYCAPRISARSGNAPARVPRSMRGHARRLVLSGMVIDHRVLASDPFRLTENSGQRAVTGHLLGERAVGMTEVGELLIAA